MSVTNPGRSSPVDAHDGLVAALLDIERYVGRFGWDQPARLFALVDTRAFITREPELAAQFGLRADTDVLPGALTSIEQEDFHDGDDLGSTLASIMWPASVAGCALTLERAVLPPTAELELPDDPAAAAQVVAHHDARHDLRLVVGVLRSGERHGVARLASNPDDLLGGGDLVPALLDALAHTLESR